MESLLSLNLARYRAGF